MKSRLNLVIRQKLFSILFAAAALIIGAFMFWYIGDLKTKIPSSGQMKHVIAACEDIAAEAVLKSNMIEHRQIPEEVFSERAVTDESEIVGKETKVDIEKGEIIYIDHISGYENKSVSGFSTCIPLEKRAVTVPVSFYGSRDFLNAGESVDIISIYYDQYAGEMFCQTIIHNKEIINVGKTPESRQETKIFIDNPVNDSFIMNDSAMLTFYLSPKEAESVFLAVQRGIINISICPYRANNNYLERIN